MWLATCLAQDTGILLLDEPTTFLDLRYQVEILDLVRDLADQHRVAVASSCTTSTRPPPIADHLVLLADGQVRASGTPREVLTDEALTAVYGLRIEVLHDPETNQLTTRPLGRHTERVRALA